MLMSQTLSTSAGSTDTALTCDSPTKWTSEQRRTPGQPHFTLQEVSDLVTSVFPEPMRREPSSWAAVTIHGSSCAKVCALGALLSSCPYLQHNQLLRFQYTGQETVGDLGAETGIIAGKKSWNKITELGLCAYWAVTLHGICVMIKYRNSYLQEWPQDIKKRKG